MIQQNGEILLPMEERKDVTMVALCEILLCNVANRQKRGTRRHNQTVAAIERLHKIDATYPGNCHENFKQKLEGIAAELEAALDQFCNA